MKIQKITSRALLFLTVFSLLIFIAGIYETTRNEFMFPLGEKFVNITETPTEIYNDYLEFKNSYVFSNSIIMTDY